MMLWCWSCSPLTASTSCVSGGEAGGWWVGQMETDGWTRVSSVNREKTTSLIHQPWNTHSLAFPSDGVVQVFVWTSVCVCVCVCCHHLCQSRLSEAGSPEITGRPGVMDDQRVCECVFSDNDRLNAERVRARRGKTGSICPSVGLCDDRVATLATQSDTHHLLTRAGSVSEWTETQLHFQWITSRHVALCMWMSRLQKHVQKHCKFSFLCDERTDAPESSVRLDTNAPIGLKSLN